MNTTDLTVTTRSDVPALLRERLEDGVYQNPVGSPAATAGRLDFWRFMLDGLTGRRVASPPVPPEHVLTGAAAAQGWDAVPGDKLQWLGHSAFRWQVGGVTLLSDPLLTDRASPFSFVGPQRFVPSPLAPEQAVADVILITHNHYDHLDARTLARLPNKTTVTVVVPRGVGPVVREAGIMHVVELDWNSSINVKGLTITLVPAVHFSARWIDDRNKTLWGGYVVQGGTPPKKIYLSGDTAYHPQLFKDIGRVYGPFDDGLVAIGAYEPRSIMQAVHVNPKEGVAVGRDVGARRLVGHHWGGIVLTNEPAFEPPVRFRAAGTQAGYAPADLWVMKVGETRSLE